MFVIEHVPFILAAVVSSVVGVAVVVRAHFGLARLATAVVVTGLLAGVFALVALSVRGTFFAALHVLYLHAVVSLPAVGIAALLRRPSGLVARVMAAVLVMAAPTGAYATFVEPRTLTVERADIAGARDGVSGGPVVIAVLSDIQARRIGPHERRAVDAALRAHPDLILIPGDVFQGRSRDFDDELPAFRQLLARLSAPGGVYLVEGDADRHERLQAMIEGTQVRLLVDDGAETTVKGRRVLIAGTSLDVGSRDAQAAIEQLRADPDEEAVRIVLAHRPDAVLTLPADDSNIDVTISGHTHGGQVQIPGVGPLITLSRVPDDVAAGGLHEVNGNAVYVSRGIGMERGDAPPLRLFCPPEVSVLTIGSSPP